MAIFRHPNDHKWVENGGILKSHNISFGGNGSGTQEWEDVDRLKEQAWVDRYNYEAKILSKICKKNNYTKILELGSGPGTLADTLNQIHSKKLHYTLIDKPHAKSQFKALNYNATKFKVLDLNNGFDSKELDKDYDLVICNDFLEHIANVTDILVTIYNLTKKDASLFVSVPNWRMGHSFQYQGLFDHDNWMHTLKVHGWEPYMLYPSPLKCQPLPRLSSEETLPENFIDSWNLYYETKKIN